MFSVRVLLIGLVIGPLAAAADWSSDIELVKDMVVLDKAYIPALLITKEGDAARATAAVEQLADSWSAFQLKWKDTVNEDWQSGFERIDQLVAESTQLTATDLRRAHSLLDEIRQILFRLRKEEEISYFVDFVTSVENALDDVVQTVAQDRHTPMTSDELDLAEKNLLLVQQRWKTVAETRLDKIVYRIDIYYMGDVASTRAEGVLLLDELTRDVRKLDRVTLNEKVEQLVYNVQHFLEILGATPGA